MQKLFLKKGLIIGIILLISSVISPLLTADNLSPKDSLVSLSVYGKSDVKNRQIMLSFNEAKFIYDLFEELQNKIINDSFTDGTENLQTSFINLLHQNGLLPDGISNEEVIELLYPSFIHQLKQNRRMTGFLPSPTISSSKASAFFCSIISGGTGKTTPIVIGPRPHGVIFWKGIQGLDYTITTVGGINSGEGFIAYGNQNGMAIGFEGIGLTYGTPLGTIYGFTGYAFYTSVTADDIEFYPPNNKPEILNPNPSNNQVNIPITLSELNFQILDDDNDLMSYSVTTEPYIGSGSKNNVGNGIYNILVDGLQSSSTYSWTVTVTDGKDTTTKIFSFKTIMERPVVTNPKPSNGSSATTDLSELSCTLTDAQGDKMDYTIQTSPNIGSSYATDVRDVTYSLQISKLNENIWYYWYVNVTDGEHWTKEIFRFYAGGKLIGYWSFDEGNGDTVYDSSGNGNNGMVNDCTWVPGYSGTALEFAHADSMVYGIPETLDDQITDYLSIEAWIKWYGQGGYPYGKIIFDIRMHWGGFLFLISPDNKLVFSFLSDGSYHDLLGSSTIAVNTWTHVQAIFDYNSHSMSLFVNNKLDNTITIPYAYSSSHNNGVIGNNLWAPGDGQWAPFNGVIDELIILKGKN
jgi:hypothetical protein